MNDNKPIPEIWLLSVNIINSKEILIFLILRLSRINKVRLQDLYLALCKHSLEFGRKCGIIHFFRRPIWNHIMKINKVEHDKCDWSSDTSLYLQSGINVLSACYFTYLPKTQQEQNFRKSLIISYGVNALQLNFLKILCYHILLSHKSLSSN